MIFVFKPDLRYNVLQVSFQALLANDAVDTELAVTGVENSRFVAP